jgi:hypothetical protein
MAAALFIGTNAWAEDEFRVGSNHYSSLQDAIDAAGDGATIYLEDNFSSTSHAWLGAEKHVILDLQGNTLEFNCSSPSGNVAMAVTKGTLEIKNGTITNANANTEDLIRVYGSDVDCTIDAKSADPFAHLIVNSDATLQNLSTDRNVIAIDVYRPDQAPKFGQTATGDLNYTCVYNNNSSKYGFANGARVDVYGTLNANKYGIKVNGMVRDPQEWNLGADKRNYTPFVYVHDNAIVTTTNSTKAVALYSSGYGRWRVEGDCSGATGIYAKSGEVEITGDSHITSTQSDAVQPQTGTASGVNAGGSAIVVESNANYSGNISIVISGDPTIAGAGGYAIEETIASNVPTDVTEVEVISIQGGTLSGNAGAIIVEDETKDEVTVAGGTIEGTIQVSGNTVTAQTVEEFIQGSSTTDPAEEADYLVTKSSTEPSTPGVTYTVTPNTSKVITLNAYGMTTFSAPYNRAITHEERAAGLKAYVAEYTTANGEEILHLTPITTSTDTIITANTGVIIMGAVNQTYSLKTSDVASSETYPANNLKAATLWSNTDIAETKDIIEGEVHANAYVLSGNLMYKYEGANMKANKAYLDLAGSPAPRRIRMVVEQEEQTEAIENVETTTEKAQKVVENGQILIKRGERVYNVQGQIVK